MQSQYPRTYDYMMAAIERGKVSNLSSFNHLGRSEILGIFFLEVTPNRLIELNEDSFAETRLEMALLYPDSQTFKITALDIIWDKYEQELDEIFDAADTEHFKEMGGISDEEDWQRADLSQRCQDISALNTGRKTWQI